MGYPKNWQPGNIVKIPLKGGFFSYGVVIKFPLMAFLNFRNKNEAITISAISSKPILFKVWVMKYALSKDWKIIGTIALDENLRTIPLFFKKDSINGKYFIYSDDGEDLPATYEEIKNLECAAAWDPKHVEDRLNDFYDHKSNRWVESLKPKNPAHH